MLSPSDIASSTSVIVPFLYLAFFVAGRRSCHRRSAVQSVQTCQSRNSSAALIGWKVYVHGYFCCTILFFSPDHTLENPLFLFTCVDGRLLGMRCKDRIWLHHWKDRVEDTLCPCGRCWTLAEV